jgi:hypothetical protein
VITRKPSDKAELGLTPSVAVRLLAPPIAYFDNPIESNTAPPDQSANVLPAGLTVTLTVVAAVL